ncbi:unnamed protein product [Mytilus edulis]|uniref:RNA-directed DNA polymerase n=1 Tax=Mytilus edulis TaxID=6550 RepID=A0A8S3T342_MYTED|nr:unnamed protein product [Mytilus edulis]
MRNVQIRRRRPERDIFLSVCGKNTYKLIRVLLAPVKPGTKSLADLTKLVNDHRDPVPSEIIQRFKFNSITRHSNESVRTFIAAQRSLTEHGNYSDTLHAMLRDRLVVGIKRDRIQRRLLAEPNLTFEKTLEIATTMETVEKNAQTIQASGTNAAFQKINQVSKSYTRNNSGNSKQGDCYQCGGNHLAAECRFKDAKCHSCKKKGHIAKKCRNKSANGNLSENHREFKSRFKPSADFMEQDESSESESENEVYSVFHFGNTSNEAYKLQINVNECEKAMEIDTGASVSIMSEDTYKDYKSEFRIEPTSAKLRTYMGEQIPVIGRAIVNVNYKKERAKLPLLIVKRKGPNLLGRDWLEKLQLDWKDIFSVVGSDNQSSDLHVILEAKNEVFKDELGTVKGTKAKIYVDESAVPEYFKARPLPYALKDKVEMELERLEKVGQIQEEEFSDWAAPIVPVVKENGSIRICGDYRVTVNAVSKLDNYPIPKTEDLYATLGGGQEYTKLDLNQAYQQIELDEDSKRLPYGVTSTPGIFQRTLENVVQGIANILVRVDDILITGKTREEHLNTLSEVLSRSKRIGIRLKKQKCVFMAEEVVYLGFKINKHGIYPVESKVEAIDKAPSPTNVTELKAYLGMLNYYNRFLASLSHLLKPLHVLLQKDTKWSWEKEQEKAFIESKQLLKSASVLVHFDPKKKLILACDASPYGLGAVLSHKMDDGSEKPIAYTSRTLTSAEKNYSVLEKESLAIIFGIKKFHQYLYGHPVTIITDHKPLIGLFREDKPLPTMAASRIQRWALTLAAYEYTIVYKEGSLNGNADGLSRLPLKTNIEKTPGLAPSELLIKRKLKSRLDLVFPNIEKRVQERQQKQKHYHDKKSVNRQINVGQGVFARNFAIGSKIKWIPGEVIKQSGPLSFHIKLQDGRVIRRHIDHIRLLQACKMTHEIEPLVSCRWLKEKLLDKALEENVVVCDVSWSSQKDMENQYKSCHIPGAVFFKIMDEAEFSEIFPRNLPAIDTFEQTAREAGINKDDHIILYSDSDMNGFFMSGRAWWTFKSGNFAANFTNEYIRHYADLVDIVETNSIQICDSRHQHKYSGPESSGNIKGSRNIPLSSLMNQEDGTLKSITSIKNELSSAGVDLSKPVITHCNSGMSSCGLCFILHLCGCPGTSVFLGGFTEWKDKAPKELIQKVS